MINLVDLVNILSKNIYFINILFMFYIAREDKQIFLQY